MADFGHLTAKILFSIFIAMSSKINDDGDDLSAWDAYTIITILPVAKCPAPSHARGYNNVSQSSQYTVATVPPLLLAFHLIIMQTGERIGQPKLNHSCCPVWPSWQASDNVHRTNTNLVGW